MRARFIIPLFFFLSFASFLHAQINEPTQTQFRGVFTWRNVSAYPDTSIAHYYAQLSDFNDQTGEYLANDIDSLCTAWDNLGGRWDIVQVDSATIANAWVLIKSLNPVYASPFGIGFVSLETSGTGLSLTAPDNSTGISPQLQSRIESHNMILIDGILTGIIGDSITSFFADADSGTLQEVSSGDTLRILGGYGINTASSASDTITVVVDTLQIATLSDVAAVQADINAHEVADGDLSATNEIQQIDTLSLSGTVLNASLSNDGVAAKTVNLSGLLSGYVTGSGTAGRVPRWTSSSALGDGVLRDDGTLLAIGGATVSGYSFYDYSTGGWRLATGTTAQRPTNAAGVHRYNTSLGYSETANGSAWLQSDFPAGTSGQTLRHDGTSWIANSFLYNRGDFVGINFSGTPANTLHVAGGLTIEEVGTGNDFFNLSSSTGFINFGNRGAGWGMATSATGSSDEDGAVWRFFPSTRYDDSGFTNIGYAFLGRINSNQTVNHTIFQIRDEGISAPTSGTSIRTYLEILPQINKGASANLTAVGISINPTLTSVTDFYGITIGNNAYKAIWQSGASATNHLAGNTIIGATTTPAQILHVAGTMRLTGSDGTATALMGRDADGDVSAVSEGYGMNVAGGALEVDTTQIATQSDLAAISPTTLYTGDGLIDENRTVTLAQDSSLLWQTTSSVAAGLDLKQQFGYIDDWGAYGAYTYGLSDDFEMYSYMLDDGSDAYFGFGVADNAAFSTAFITGGESGTISMFGNDGTDTGDFGLTTTPAGFAPRVRGDNGIEFDTGAGGVIYTQINNSTIHVTTATGLGINDTSPEKSLDVGGMGKFRQLSGQDNSVTIGTNANAGTGRSASITDAQSSDVAGRFSFTTGTGLTAGEWVTLTWGATFDNPPAVQLFAEDADGASLAGLIYVVPTTTGCSIAVNTNSATYESRTYEFNYIVIQGK